MNSHILSDVEALCDRAAVLKGGRLAHSGTLAELRAQASAGHRRMELVFEGARPQELLRAVGTVGGASAVETPSGARVELPGEEWAAEVIRAAQEAGGHLVSAQTVGQSLEELFR